MGNLMTKIFFGSQSTTTDHNAIPSNKTYQNPHQSVSERDRQMEEKTGVEKSATENTTLGKESSESDLSRKSLTKHDKLRIVMVGKTGVGKSATGNTILGKQIFKSEFSPESLTVNCDKAVSEVDGQNVAVIDTPGLFDTRIDEEKTRKDIAQCISFASPGPHVFLIIIRLGRFTEEEKQTVQKIQEIFGEDADKYSMVLFTHGDLLKGKPIEDFVGDSKDLRELVAKCNGQYHVFNNDLEDRSQVRELLNKIRKITEKNGGSHYTTEMFQKAEKEIEERKQQILKENEEKNRKEQEELEKQIKEKYEKEMREANEEREKQLKEMYEKEMRKANEEREMQLKEKYEKEMREANAKKETQLKEKYEKEMREANEERETQLKEKYEKEMREANAKKEKELKEAYERELREKIKKLKENQGEEARREAEKSTSLLVVILELIKETVCPFLFK